MTITPQQPHGALRSYGRIKARPIKARQAELLDTLGPQVEIPEGPFDPRSLMPDAEAVWLEIGFGGGEHLVWQAEHNPGTQFIGCEPFEDGVVKVLTAIEDKKLGNIRLHPDDARPLLRALPQASISRAFILFPDPWPKKRHAKRRLVNAETLTLLARAMRPGAELRIATDIADYARTALLAARDVAAFRWTAQSPADWRIQGSDWPQTRYQAKALRDGRRCYFFKFLRV